MYKILIADDEIWIRQRLSEMIPWSKINAEVVGVCEDGTDALNQVEVLNPDVVVTDIRMPGLDGIELMRELKKIDEPPKVIILSGYSDFSYAKEGIQYGVSDYILKPVEEEELLSAVQKCLMEIKIEKEKKSEISKLHEKVQIGNEALKEKMLVTLLLGDFYENYVPQSNDGLYSMETFFEDSIRKSLHLCVLVHIDDYMKMGSDKQMSRFVVHNVVRELLERHGICESAFFHNMGEMVFVLSMDQNESDNIGLKLKEELIMAKDLVRKYIKFTLSVAVGRICEDFWDISCAYDSARMFLKYRKWFGKDNIYDEGSTAMTKQNLGRYSVTTLGGILRREKLEEAETEVYKIFKVIKSTTRKEEQILTCKMAAADIVDEYYFYFLNHMDRNSAYLFRSEFWNIIDNLNGDKELIDFIYDFIEKHPISVNKTNKISSKAIEYVSENYRNPISLNDVAAYLELNASYFCRVFKDEVGISFISYLQKYRIDKAIEFMKNQNYKIYEIGNMVGYENQQYFNKVFRNIKGLSPAA